MIYEILFFSSKGNRKRPFRLTSHEDDYLFQHCMGEAIVNDNMENRRCLESLLKAHGVTEIKYIEIDNIG